MTRTILVEPDAAVRDAITEIDDGGLSVVALACGWDIFGLFDRIESPALLVSDINLGPMLDGLKLATAARCRWAGLPVICITSRPVRYAALTCEPCDWSRMVPLTPEGFLDAAHCLGFGGLSHVEGKGRDRDGIYQRYRPGNRNGFGGARRPHNAQRLR
jgi:CheY-like chemotaxis protein